VKEGDGRPSSDLQFIIIIIFACPPFWPVSRFELPSSAAVYPLFLAGASHAPHFMGQPMVRSDKLCNKLCGPSLLRKTIYKKIPIKAMILVSFNFTPK
jgi:hypothetical protein